MVPDRFATRAVSLGLTLAVVLCSAAPLTAQTTPAAKTKAATAAKAVKPTPLVNLNTADLAALEALPGIGPAYAKAIIAARPFKSVDELSRVKGIGPARIEVLKPLVVATPAPASAALVAAKPAAKGETPGAKTATPKPATGKKVNLNTATEAELDSLPGIGPIRAKAIIAARPFKTIEDVMKVKGIKERQFGTIKDRISVD